MRPKVKYIGYSFPRDDAQAGGSRIETLENAIQTVFESFAGTVTLTNVAGVSKIKASLSGPRGELIEHNAVLSTDQLGNSQYLWQLFMSWRMKRRLQK